MRLLIVLVSFITFIQVQSQSFTSGLMPDITLSYKTSEDYKIIHRVESRFPSYNTDAESFKVMFERFDFQNFVERKIGLFSKVSLGYQFRINNAEANEHRFIQQFVWTDNFANYRIGHRFRTDQTYGKSNAPEFRFRYRAKIQLPLQGQNLDDREFYLSFSDEVVSAVQSSEWDLENRVVAKLGFYINDKNKLESGLDWRIDGFLLNGIENQVWFAFSWFKAL